jgi:pyocin large subunit-like protein
VSRRFIINVAAAAALIGILYWVGRASDYRPTRIPHHTREARAAGSVPESIATGDSLATPNQDTLVGTGSPAAPSSALTDAAALVRHAEVGFESHDRLLEHYEKHGAEFGVASPDGYLLLAQALRDRDVGGPVLEARRSDGVTTRFDRGSGAFIAFESDGTIRTFFRPNDGENYFWRQLGRPH